MRALPGLTRPWEIYLVHHTHVDIGYTEPQPIVVRKHADFIAQVLDLCAATDHLPPGERFAWTCEVAWSVKAFLTRYPQRADEFFSRVREGRIEVTGLYVQLTDLFSEALLDHALSYATGLAQNRGFEVVTAMNDDVTGWAWGLPRLLAARGIRYFDTAMNVVHAVGVGPRPRPVYWASPDGSRVLMWLAESYLLGNTLGLDRGDAEQRIAAYLFTLEAGGYPHHAVEVRISGENHDNSPPGPWICEAVRAWNERWDHPQIHLCTPRLWFEHLEANWPQPIPELRAAWPDWWADGNGSALRESALVRAAQADLATCLAAEAAGAKLDHERADAAREAAMLFCEHTWGSWRSTDDPHATDSRAQWGIKAAFAHVAGVEAAALVRDTLQTLVPRPVKSTVLMVFNPLPHARSDLVEVLIPDEAVVADAAAWVPAPRREDEGPPLYFVDQLTGEVVVGWRRPAIADSARRPAQRVLLVARDVPARGWRAYRVVAGVQEASPHSRQRGRELESRHFRVTVDPVTGGLASVIAAASNRELVARGDYTLNQHIYEVIESPAGREALSDWRQVHRDARFRRSTPTVRIIPGPPLPFGASIIVEGGGGDVPLVRSHILLYDDLPRIDLLNEVTKLPWDRAEAIYHAFPLSAISPVVYLHVAGAVMRPGIDQVPGTATDWHGIQDYFCVADEDWTTVVASPDVPLVQVNGINTGRWQRALPPHNGLVMSWVMNNYWFTNFPATQGGTVAFRYSVGCGPGSFDGERAARFAASIRQPLVGLLVRPGD